MENSKKDESPCHQKRIPLWLVLLDNLPTLLLIVIGGVIISKLSVIWAIGYLIYSVFSIVWFWAKICPFCHHYGTFACPCGYGIISEKFFNRRTDKSFKVVFKRNILIVFPNWFVPFFTGIYMLIFYYSKETLILTIVFSVIGFIIIPLISKYVGCKDCEIKENCPWMQNKMLKVPKK